jgi:DHA1 family multidrug resistance protein-like MFS transporter
MLIAVVYAFGGMMPETYPREILRRRARKAGVPHKLPKAQSGVTLGEMAQLTIIQPVIMLFIDPITLFSTLYVAFIFGTVFQWFIAVPPVLSKTYNFTLDQAGLAFIAAIGGAILAAASSILIERSRKAATKA